jgi:hypothetical protein
MTRVRKRRRGFYARLARLRGVPVQAVYRELNPDKRPCARAQQECDASWTWSRDDLERMDRAFCAALRREIANGAERPPAPAVPGARQTPGSPRGARKLPSKQLRVG